MDMYTSITETIQGIKRKYRSYNESDEYIGLSRLISSSNS